MIIKFKKAWGSFKVGAVAVVNDNFGKSAIAKGIAEHTDNSAKITELPNVSGKGEGVEEKKSENKPKAKPRKSTPSK